jgi:hypothetical protein
MGRERRLPPKSLGTVRTSKLPGTGTGTSFIDLIWKKLLAVAFPVCILYD